MSMNLNMGTELLAPEKRPEVVTDTYYNAAKDEVDTMDQMVK